MVYQCICEDVQTEEEYTIHMMFLLVMQLRWLSAMMAQAHVFNKGLFVEQYMI